ncbi:putative pectinesterase/pectinesterase inhibitor 32 [Capsicum baccatum]|uniref:Pectinesterase/pectinesterase inhibitor 32 n=1 Tax=Capsicum baccatum TaxID=33114 RepID=A0A2G2VTF5_CAPBA|nr:putative pectinesterase/pectinesterase inhibitor 32 [Capsicum baccatum]
MASLNPWGKLDEVQNERLMARRNTRKRITFIIISSIVLVSIIVGAVVGGFSHNNNKSSQQNDNVLSIFSTIRTVCKLTLYLDSCISSLSPYAAKSNALKPQDIYKMSVLVALNELFGASDKFFKNYVKSNDNVSDPLTKGLSREGVERTSKGMVLRPSTSQHGDYVKSKDNVLDPLRKGLSREGVERTSKGMGLRPRTSQHGEQLHYFGNIALLQNWCTGFCYLIELMNWLNKQMQPFSKRRTDSWKDMTVYERVESLMNRHEFTVKILHTRIYCGYNKIKVNAVVAKDCSGKYKTIKVALKVAPDKNKKRFVIYVKKGIYIESVRVEKTKWNIMIIGDGKDATVVSGNRNFIDGTPTFQSATFDKFSFLFSTL